SVDIVSKRIGRPESELADVLYKMSKKGLILRGTIEGQTFYFMAPWMVGIWEFQLNNMNKDNIPLYEKFFEEGMVPERGRTQTAGFRVIPIEREIQDRSEVQPYEKVSEIIESSHRFAVADCICRKEAGIMGHGCDKLLEACLSFDLAADYYIENGLGREISKEEAQAILSKAEESGLVHHSSNHKGGKMFICNCCGCCCKAMAHINKYNNLTAIAQSNYYAAVDSQTCTACETCLERCQVKAIEIADDVSVITKDRCIGCGLCVSTCPTGSITLVPKQSAERSAIFESDIDLVQAAAKEKNKIFPFE
ncbi:MAG: 4Fe-4S binding protein, partial [Deltaproteobacteria bacterium]|nr:4Fe-4S binding protein [Deltaproteobacteria bacterium]